MEKKNCMVNSWEKQRDGRSKEWWKQVSWNGKPRALYMLPKNKHSTNNVKNGSDHQGVSPLCRLYKGKIESVTHFVSSCSVLAGTQYRKRHDKLRKKYTGSCPSWKPIQEEIRQTWKKTHWLLCKKFEIECEDKWFSHQPESVLVLENEKCKILWDPGRYGNRTSKARHSSYW